MSTFDEEVFEKKLVALKDTHESISSLSQWCLDRPQHHKKIVSIWLQTLKKVKIEQRLTLFHLANDVIQYSKRKGYDFVESWGTALQKATTMVRDDKVKNKILRLFKIWDERSIYDEAFLVDLSGLLSSRKPAQNNQDAQDFQPINLISKIRSCKNLEDDTDSKRRIVNESHLSLNDADSLRSFLKDRRHGADLEQELEEGVDKMMAYISALKAEIQERTLLIETLDLSESFYENQRGEAKIVCNAYRNFSKRVENLKKKLDEMTKSLPSPLPSPDVNAPSPSPESDIELPDDSVIPGKYSAASSFIGTLVVPENVKLTNPSEEIYSLIDSPPRKMGYKPPTPPRSFKRKSSPKPYHSPPPTAYVSSTTPTLSSSSASNYSSNSPYQPVSKPNVYTPNTTTYSSYSHTVNTSYPSNTSYSSTNTNYYNPEENDQMNSFDSNTASQDSYHLPGTNPPAPTSFINPPPPSEYPPAARNPSPTYPATTVSPTYQNQTSYQTSRKYPPTLGRFEDQTPPAPPPDYSIPPPLSSDYRPFYSSSSNLTVPPLLGEDCPPSNINGLDSFLQSENSANEDPPNAPATPLVGSGSGFSSFMGNLSLPFDFQQKGLFLETSGDNTPASPPPEALDDNTSHYFSDSNQEGKPIEVINRTKQPDLSEILKAISMQPPPGTRGGGGGDMELSSPSPTMPPPPLPPRPLEDDEGTDKQWSQPPLLPPKFPTWGQDDWTDTPASPPLYEKSGFGEPVEFEESDSLALGDTDTDLRALGLQGDIDHRNLISLTSSPRDEAPWASTQDTDYRKMVLAPKRAAQDDNVESVDMEMSSDEEVETEQTKPVASVSFSLASHTKPLVDSPLKEKEEPKKKLLSFTLTPTTKKLEAPPPMLGMSDMDNLYLEVGEKKEETKKLTPPPPPPPPPLAMAIQPIPTVQEVPVVNSNFPPSQRPRGFLGPRFNNQRQRFPHWQNNPNSNINNQNSNVRPRQPPMTGPRFRPDGNLRGRPPWFRGNARPPRYAGW